MRALDWRAQVSDGLPWSRLRKKRTSVLQGIFEKAKVALRDHRIEVGGIGFSVEPKRWIVERTLGWFGVRRRLSKEYERLVETSAATTRLVSLQIAPCCLNCKN